MAISRKKIPACPIEVTINAVAARWKAMILWQLRPGARAYGELKRVLPRISDRMLSTQLAQLAEDGVVTRNGDGSAARWSLTPLGHQLLPVLDAMQRWGESRIAQQDASVGVDLAATDRGSAASQPSIA